MQRINEEERLLLAKPADLINPGITSAQEDAKVSNQVLPAQVFIGSATVGLPLLSLSFIKGSAMAAAISGPAGVIVGGAFGYGIMKANVYSSEGKAKHLTVDSLVAEINSANSVEGLLSKARLIVTRHADFLRTERGLYSSPWAQSLFGGYIGHIPGNTQSWLRVVEALRNKMQQLSNDTAQMTALNQLLDLNPRQSLTPS